MPTTAIPIKLSQKVDIHTWIFSAALYITAEKRQGEWEESEQGYSHKVLLVWRSFFILYRLQYWEWERGKEEKLMFLRGKKQNFY